MTWVMLVKKIKIIWVMMVTAMTRMTWVINDFGADALKLPGFTVYDGWSTRHLYAQPVMLSYACILCYAVPCFVCYAFLCLYPMLCTATLSYVMLSYACILCYAVPCFAMLCFALLSSYDGLKALQCFGLSPMYFPAWSLYCVTHLCISVVAQTAMLDSKICSPNYICFAGPK